MKMLVQVTLSFSIVLIKIIFVDGSLSGDVNAQKCPKFARLREHKRECVYRWADRIQEMCVYPGQKTPCYNDINIYVMKNTTSDCLPYEAAGKICSGEMYVEEKIIREKIVANVCCVFDQCLQQCYGPRFRRATRGDYRISGHVTIEKVESHEDYDD